MTTTSITTEDRLHSLDAVRAFALLLGVLFHATMSFLPGLPAGAWPMKDSSPSATLEGVFFVSHIFRMSLFFLMAGFFGHLLFHRRGARGFWADRAKRILLPLVVGWLVVFPAIVAVFAWGFRLQFGGAGAVAPPAPPPLPKPVGAFPLTHLWFLYYLLVLYVVVVGVRSAVVALDREGRARRLADSAVRFVVSRAWAGPLLALPLAVAFFLEDPWMPKLGIPTPDQSLIPQVVSLVAYGGAVAFGWLLHRQAELLSAWRRRWPGYLTIAVAASAGCWWLADRGVPIDASLPADTLPVVAASTRDKALLALGYAVAVWCWIFAITGIALRFLSTESRARRYVADASYWIYLGHLPIVMAFQVLVGPLPWHWSVKLAVILIGSLALLLSSYHVLVRYTWIGAVLNGRRRRRSDARSSPTSKAPAGATADARKGSPAVLAALRGVRKTYGATKALDGLDLEVRRGELLAVLGPNGAGKSTAISLWLGLIEPDEHSGKRPRKRTGSERESDSDGGAVELMGRSPLDIESRREVGVMMQEVTLAATLRVRELVELAASYYPSPLSAREAMELTRTTALAERLYGKLSAGQKRQAQFAIAICGRPKLLFLDEPTVGLDVEARATMWSTIRALVAQGCSIVLTTHYLEEAEMLADRVAVLAKGRLIAEGRVEEVRAVVSRKRITCTTKVRVDDVRAWPEVVEAERPSERERLQIVAIDAEAVVRRLLAADDGLRDLDVRQAGLAEAFVELTREAA
jgi:ABC-type multidrug transport system ATPase subunit/peptidoglycan/LPS O-acetylase OafA/YrhL